MRKTLFCLLLIMLCLSISAIASANETSLTLECKSAVLMDAASGEILFEQNSHEQCYPASVTKIMTLVLVLEAIEDGSISLDDQVMVSEAAAGMGGSQVYLYAGEERSVDEMLVAIAVGSGNDASYAMAEFVGGSMTDFVTMMNKRAKELGMNDSNFVNPHGLHDDNHYTTAYDMGILAKHALTLDKFLDYTSIYEYEFRPEPKLLTLWNTNRLLKWYDGTDGMKTGYTEEAGRNLVATVLRDNMRLISVVLGAEERQGHFNQSMTLLNYGFNKFEYSEIHAPNEVICEAPVSKGKKDSVKLVVEKSVGYSAEKNTSSNINESIEIDAKLKAPLKVGDVAGKLIVYRDGSELVTVDLVVAEDVEKGGFFRTWGKMLRTM